MPIFFVSLNDEFIKEMTPHYPTRKLSVDKYVPTRRTYYISPANSLGFMAGGIDYPLAHIIMPGIERTLRAKIAKHCKGKYYGDSYLPIGSSIIIDYDDKKSLVSAPTMLVPSNVADTQNAYYSTMAVMHNIFVNRRENINDVDVIMTSMCCGCGGMEVSEAVKQMLKAMRDYPTYNPTILDRDIIIAEPNLEEQPQFNIPAIRLYQHNSTEDDGTTLEDVDSASDSSEQVNEDINDESDNEYEYVEDYPVQSNQVAEPLDASDEDWEYDEDNLDYIGANYELDRHDMDTMTED